MPHSFSVSRNAKEVFPATNSKAESSANANIITVRVLLDIPSK